MQQLLDNLLENQEARVLRNNWVVKRTVPKSMNTVCVFQKYLKNDSDVQGHETNAK